MKKKRHYGEEGRKEGVDLEGLGLSVIKFTLHGFSSDAIKKHSFFFSNKSAVNFKQAR